MTGFGVRLPPGLPAHVATTRHLCAAYPLVAEAGLGHEGVLVGRDVLGGSFVYDPFALYRKGTVTNPNMLDATLHRRGKGTFRDPKGATFAPMSEGPALLAEAHDPDTSEARLLELASGPDQAAAATAAGRLVRAAMDSAGTVIAGATDPGAQVGAALGLVLDALRLVPGSVVGMGPDEIGQALSSAGWSADTTSQLVLAGLLNLLVDQQPARIQETIRGLAPDWVGSVLELIEAAVALESQPPPA